MLLAIENLRTYFYSRPKRAFVRAVDGASLAVARGETLGVVGESGSGKTVAALSVAGLVGGAPGVIGGRIEFDSRNLLDGLERYVKVEERGGRVTAVEKDEPGWRKRAATLMAGVRGKEIAMIFQNPRAALNPYSTIGAQLVEAIRLHTRFKTKNESRDRALHWLERVRIDSPRLRFDNFPFGMSGGMCQRAMIAMALSAEPSLLIADEPTTGLDATIQSRIVELLAELKAETGTATLLISHDISVIQRLSDRVAVMNNGLVEQLGAPAEIYERPATRFVADFIGTSNLLSGTVGPADAAGHHRVDLGEGLTALVAELPKGISAGSLTHLTVRPEKVRIGTERPEGDLSVMPGTVAETVYLGSATHYQVSLANGSEVTVYQQNSSDSALVAGRGDDVWLSWAPRHSYALPV